MLVSNLNMTFGRLVRLALLLIVTCAAIGCGGGGGGGGSDTTAPVIGDPTYTSPTSSRSGTMTVSVPVTDSGSGVAGVALVVTKHGDGQTTTQMSLVNGVYTADYAYDANTGTEPMTYSFVIRATDNAGNQATSTTFSFVVPANDAPPPPPAF